MKLAIVAVIAVVSLGLPLAVALAAPPVIPPVGPACKPPPAKARIKVSLKPDTEVTDLITWYSHLSCTPLVVSSSVATAGKKVTLLSPNPMTLAEIEGVFVAALGSVGLTIERAGKLLTVIDAANAPRSRTPLVAPPR